MQKLTRRERDKEKELAGRIQAAGIPLVVEPNKNEEPEILIRQDVEAYESTVFDVNGGAGLILPIRITPNVPVFELSGIDISLARWPNVWFRPLEENYGGEWPHYSFYGRSELNFDRRETINRVIEKPTEFRRGHTLHGLFLAFSSEPMPDEIVRGAVLHGSIKILDQFDHGHSAKITLRAHREAIRVPKLNPLRRKLFAHPPLEMKEPAK
jgi:hypothetical protein